MNYGSKRWRPWMLEEDEARENFAYAIEHGVNFFDTSNIYSLGMSEQIVGPLGTRTGESANRCGGSAPKPDFPWVEGPNQAGLSRKHLIDSCEASLRRLRMDHIDLYQIHRLGFGDATGRNIGGSRSPRARRKDPLHRRQQHGGVAIFQGSIYGPRA